MSVKKMNYQPPVLASLSTGWSDCTATGASADSCHNGTVATGGAGDDCYVGTVATVGCASGTTPGGYCSEGGSI